jgi:hypothetical protein
MVESMAQQVFAEAEQRMKATMGALDRVLASLAGVRGRKTVLLVSEGFVHDPQNDRFRQVARRAAEASAEVTFVDARALDSDLPTMADAEIRPAANPQKALDIIRYARQEAQGAETIALDSGGLIVRGGNNLAGALDRAARESRVYYLLGYTSTRGQGDPGKFRRIEVKVGRPGLKVRARKGYYPGRTERARTSSTPTSSARSTRRMPTPTSRCAWPPTGSAPARKARGGSASWRSSIRARWPSGRRAIARATRWRRSSWSTRAIRASARRTRPRSS